MIIKKERLSYRSLNRKPKMVKHMSSQNVKNLSCHADVFLHMYITLNMLILVTLDLED